MCIRPSAFKLSKTIAVGVCAVGVPAAIQNLLNVTGMTVLNIVTTFNLCYNAAVMAKQGVGCVVSLDKLADTSADSPLCFRPLEPRLESGLDIVWKKYQVFSPAAEAFLNRLRERCAESLGC